MASGQTNIARLLAVHHAVAAQFQTGATAPMPEVQGTQQQDTEHTQPTSHSLLNTADGVAVITRNGAPSLTEKATWDPCASAHNAIAGSNLCAAQHISSISSRMSVDEGLLQEAQDCFSEAELRILQSNNVSEHELQQHLWHALQTSRTAVQASCLSTIPHTHANNSSEHQSSHQLGGDLESCSHAWPIPAASTAPTTHAMASSQLYNQFLQSRQAPLLSTASQAASMQAGPGPCQLSSGVPTEQGGRWELDADTSHQPELGQEDLQAVEILCSLRKPQLMPAQPWRQSQQQPQQQHKRASAQAQQEQDIPPAVAVLAASFLRAWNSSESPTAGQPWSEAAREAYAAMVAAAAHAPQDCALAGATGPVLSTPSVVFNAAAPDINTCTPHAVTTGDAGCGLFQVHTTSGGAGVELGSFEASPVMPFGHFASGPRSNYMGRSEAAPRAGSMSAQPAGRPTGGRSSAARGGRSAGPKQRQPRAASQAGSHTVQLAAMVPEAGEVHHQSPVKSLFAATERWMREVQETIPIAMQEIIRADWLAKEGLKELDVLCKDVPAKFFVDPATQRCMIRTESGRLITPNVFEAECGAANSKAWLQSIWARDYLQVIKGHSEFGPYHVRHICLGHFTRIVNIKTSRK